MMNGLCSWGKKMLSASVLAGVMFSPAAQANWQIDGTLIIPPVCQLGQQDPIRVPFGKVGVRKVDGVAFKKDIPYQIDCLGDMSHPWDVTLTFGGTLAGAGFDNATLSTITPLNSGKLGIQIQKNGQPLELNKAFAIDVGTPPILSAVPVKRAGTELVGDDFTATGTLTIAFQ
ncbi:fimbrial protein [Serratia fonticola]|uniref:fimbrial protein n=1 Tax=Serratia fonticola TaxID=47917 RepID=UPI00042909E5|nr:fimbrial protein [Serratia fonticola]CAI0971744.1 putative minor fimbrial subunit StfF [Serratia fonticola]